MNILLSLYFLRKTLDVISFDHNIKHAFYINTSRFFPSNGYKLNPSE